MNVGELLDQLDCELPIFRQAIEDAKLEYAEILVKDASGDGTIRPSHIEPDGKVIAVEVV